MMKMDRKQFHIVVCVLLAFLLSACQKSDVTDLNFLAYKSDESVSVLTQEEAMSLKEEITSKIEDGILYGECYDKWYSDQDIPCQYALYTMTQDHGDAFSVTLNVMTVERNAQETVEMVWFANTPKQWTSYEVIPTLLKDTIEDKEFIFISGYEIRVYAEKSQKVDDYMGRFGYSLFDDHVSGTGMNQYYTAYEHIDIVTDSAFKTD